MIAHAVIGSIFGYLYLNVGTMATTVLGNYVYMYGSMLLVVYTGKMSVMMACKYKALAISLPFTILRIIILLECVLLKSRIRSSRAARV